ncbi:hypothetical protein TcasGA2_TC001436 [Tribolium castaneum]|uniref:Uncharacterized protein n=1 Tax=Tribolium castaneum TaxID=7070 RepID=D7EIL3_TRICA|nr:hypothetical protein TcasGA2_TC001436 [Tribolium castaneum]
MQLLGDAPPSQLKDPIAPFDGGVQHSVDEQVGTRQLPEQPTNYEMKFIKRQGTVLKENRKLTKRTQANSPELRIIGSNHR